jgi:hypothetical protein
MGEILYVMPETRQQGIRENNSAVLNLQASEIVMGIINQSTANSPKDGYLGATS